MDTTKETAHQWLEDGHRLFQAGRYREAIAVLDSAIALDARLARAYFTRGACRYSTGNYRQAIDDLNAAALLGCEDAQFWSKFEQRTETDITDEDAQP